MTSQQYERWKDFALRMARTCYRKARRPDAKWIEGVVADFFDHLDEGVIPSIVSWDHSTDGTWCIGDTFSEFVWGYTAYCNPVTCAACSRDEFVGECRCDEIEMLRDEQWSEQWGGPVHCCVRAGLDCASAPSAGVVGFTAGHVRCMYPEGVPQWVFPPGERLQDWLSGELNGTFAELPDSMGVVL